MMHLKPPQKVHFAVERYLTFYLLKVRTKQHLTWMRNGEKMSSCYLGINQSVKWLSTRHKPPYYYVPCDGLSFQYTWSLLENICSSFGSYFHFMKIFMSLSQVTHWLMWSFFVFLLRFFNTTSVMGVIWPIWPIQNQIIAHNI